MAKLTELPTPPIPKYTLELTQDEYALICTALSRISTTQASERYQNASSSLYNAMLENRPILNWTMFHNVIEIKS